MREWAGRPWIAQLFEARRPKNPAIRSFPFPFASELAMPAGVSSSPLASTALPAFTAIARFELVAILVMMALTGCFVVNLAVAIG